MEIIDFFLKFINAILDSIIYSNVLISLMILIFIFHILMIIFSDRRYIKNFRKFKDPDIESLDCLKSIPLVNIIVPAWKEGKTFEKCLISIKDLKYPRIKAIINAGGDDNTNDIAQSFKNYKNFKILHQKGGAGRPSLGKVRALNESIEFVDEGIVYFIDADSYLTDEILLRMIFPIINKNEKLVLGGVRPLENQKDKNLVKYLLFDRFGYKFSRYSFQTGITGQNFCIKFELLKSIDKFTENKKYATDRSMAADIYSKGYRGYNLIDLHHRIYVDYSDKITDFLRTKIIWTENFLVFSIQNRKILKLMKFAITWCVYLCLIIFPFFAYFHLSFVVISILILLFIYLTKIRKFLIFRFLVSKPYGVYKNYTVGFFFLLVIYIYLEIILTLIAPFHFVYFIFKLKSKK